MPRYLYRCQTCGAQDEQVRPVDDRDQPLICGAEDCLSADSMKRVFAKPAMSMDGRVFQDGRFDVNDWLANQ